MDVSSPLSWMCCFIWCNLSTDLIIEVLCRLPVKSLMQFKCVSKEWNFLITKICVPRLDASMPLSAFIFMRLESIIDMYGVITSEGHEDTEFVRSCVETIPWDRPGRRPKILWFDIICCFHGLILISKRVRPTELYLCNPATRQCVSIPVNPNHVSRSKITMSLAFNPQNNTYKIVRVEYSSENSNLLPDLEIFSSVTGKWSRFRIPLERLIIGSSWLTRFVYLNENLYMLSTSKHLLCFDLHHTDDKKLTASSIELPLKAGGPQIIYLSNECLYYLRVDESIMRIWSLETDGNKDISPWVLRYSVDMDKLRQLPHGKHLFPSYLPFEIDMASDVIYLGSPHAVLKYNLRTNKLELFHQMIDDEILVCKNFYAYRRNLVMLTNTRA